MNKQYRPLEAGEIIQEGDEYKVEFAPWLSASSYIGGFIREGCTQFQFRRPISLSTDTEALASKMAGLTDYPWHICPLGTVGAITDKHGDRYWHKDKHARVDSGDWLATGWKLIDNKGNGEDWQNSNMTIPEREKVLNGLAEISEWENVPSADSYKYDIDFAKWQERRQIRIEAGLIELPTTITDAVADAPSEWGDEDDLTWLANNVSEWSGNATFQYIGRGADTETYMGFKDKPLEGFYHYDQWLQRRRELGLEPEDNQPDWDSAPEGATHGHIENGRVVNWYKNNGKFWFHNVRGEWWESDHTQAFYDVLIPRPEQSKSTEPQEQEWKDGLPPVGLTSEQIDTPIGWHGGDFSVVAHYKFVDEDQEPYKAAILAGRKGDVAIFLKDELKPKSTEDVESEGRIRELMKDAGIDEGTRIASFHHKDSAVFQQAEKIINAGWRKVEK